MSILYTVLLSMSAQTGSIYISLNAGSNYVRRSFNPDAPGLEGLEWDSAELYMVQPPHT